MHEEDSDFGFSIGLTLVDMVVDAVINHRKILEFQSMGLEKVGTWVCSRLSLGSELSELFVVVIVILWLASSTTG